ncbi:GDP dissociation inhibitor-domain-containing protein [Limtongia smithiae]|uniref:GDP dissociation inhibitor-domain-containing protein n=1 Tax=Limtongia smithiae TaxID=1125753 RepID=UPI0034CFA4CD
MASASATSPPASAVERPPEACDVLVYGTGLVESMVAAALAWQGTNVLHIDRHPYYGGEWASLNLDELKTWTDQVNDKTTNKSPFSRAYLYISRNLDPRKYAVDISPHVLFSRSDMLTVLLRSRVSRYLEFKPLGSFHTFEQDSFEKVPGTKEDIFTSQTLSLLTKRALMRFMKFVVEWESLPTVWQDYAGKPVSLFLREKFALDTPQIVELVHAIALLPTQDVPVEVALERIKLYLTSMQVYGNFPAMYSMYGSGGELAQGFCRSAAVAGAVYRLGTAVTSFDDATGIAVLDNGDHITVAEKFITTDPSPSATDSSATTTIARMVAIVEKDCKEWFAEGESSAIVVFPVDTLDGNKYAVQALVLGGGSGQVPQGQAVWYLSTQEPGDSGRKTLFLALEKMEASILLESTEDFEFDISEDDISYLPSGVPVISSVRLGESFRNYQPKDSLKYLLKLTYDQQIAATTQSSQATSKTLYVGAPTFDITYDGVVDQAKVLYENVTGTAEDFFDIDFEDDDDDDDATATGAPADTSIHDLGEASAVSINDDINMSHDDFDEVAGEMTI